MANRRKDNHMTQNLDVANICRFGLSNCRYDVHLHRNIFTSSTIKKRFEDSPPPIQFTVGDCMAQQLC